MVARIRTASEYISLTVFKGDTKGVRTTFTVSSGGRIKSSASHWANSSEMEWCKAMGSEMYKMYKAYPGEMSVGEVFESMKEHYEAEGSFLNPVEKEVKKPSVRKPPVKKSAEVKPALDGAQGLLF
jgi:hypothetical protein